MDDKRGYGSRRQTGDGLDGGGREARIVLWHRDEVLMKLITLCCYSYMYILFDLDLVRRCYS